jgi:uncharacterized protein
MPVLDDSRVEAAYQRGLRLACDGSFFAAHEAFEEAWRACPDAERDFFQGLVHVVVSAYQRGRGRFVAAERQRVKALGRLAAFEPAHRGLDVGALRSALERGEADPREQLVQAVAQPGVLVEEQEQPKHDERDA